MRHRSHRSTHRPDHDDSHDDLDRLLSPKTGPAPLIVPRSPVRTLWSIEDRRRWDPSRPRSDRAREPARDTFGRPVRFTHKQKSVKAPAVQARVKPFRKQLTFMELREPPERLSMHDPRKAIICLKRHARREVLFALRRTKSGAGAPKRRNEWSDVEC